MDNSELAKSLFIDLDEIDNFDDYLCPTAEIGKLKPAHAYNDEVTRFMLDEVEAGAFMPWSKTTGDFRVRPSEVSVIAAQNGAGKSAIMNQIAINMLRDKYSGGKRQKVLVISPEMSVAQNMSRAIRMMTAKPAIQVDEVDIGACLSWLGSRFYMYDHLGSVDPQIVLGLIRYAAAELGVTQVVIDNLTMLKITDDANNVNLATKHFMSDAVAVSRSTGCHIWVIAHLRKPTGDHNARQDKYSVRGASEITDLADNCILIQRDWGRGEELNNLDPLTDAEAYREQLAKPSSYLEIAKQRHGEGTLRRYALWFDVPSLRFTSRKDVMPRAFGELEEFMSMGRGSSVGYQDH